MSDLIHLLPAAQLSLFAIVVASIVVLIWFHLRRGNTFIFSDLLIDPVTKKASIEAIVTLFFAILSAWYVVIKTMNPAAGNVGPELVQILMVFLVYRGVKQGIQAYKDKPPTPPPMPDQIEQQVLVTPNAAGQAPKAKLPSAVGRVTQ